MAGPTLIKQGKDKGKYKFFIRNPDYEGSGLGQSSTLNIGPFKTFDQANKEYKKRLAEGTKLKASGRQRAIEEQTKSINTFVDNFFDQNIKKYDIRDFDIFKKDLLDEFNALNIKDAGGRKSVDGDVPNVGVTGESKFPFKKYGIDVKRQYSPQRRKELGKTSQIEDFYKKLFYTGKLESDPKLKNNLKRYLDYNNTDKKFYKGNVTNLNRAELNAKYADVLNPAVRSNMEYLLNSEDVGTGKFRYGILRNFFPKEVNKYVAKKNASYQAYEQRMKQIENRLTPAQLKSVLGGETSIKKFMRNQTDLLKEIFDTSKLDKELVFALDHAEGISEIAEMKNPKDIMRGLTNLIGTTHKVNAELGLEGYSTARQALARKLKKGVNIKSNLKKLNEITTTAYPQLGDKDAYEIKNRRLVPTEIFVNQYDPNTAFTQYFKDLAQDPKGLKALKEQATKGSDLRNLISQDPELKNLILKGRQAGFALPGVLGATAILGTAGIGATKAFGDEINELMKGDEIPTLDSDVEFGDPDTWDMKIPQFIEEYPILTGAGATGAALATKPGREVGKSIVRNFPLAFNPLTAAGLTYGLRPEEGYDFSDPLTRVGFEAEAAFSKDLVRASQQAAQKISNPMLSRATQGILNLGLPARFAMGAARIATPLGLLSLAGEGAYQLYNLAQQEQDRINAMTPEQQQEFFAEQEEISRFSASEGGRAGFKDGSDPKDPTRRKFMKTSGGILGLLTAAGTGLLKLAPQAAKEVQQVTSNFSGVGPAIVEELYNTIKNFGKMTDYNKKGVVNYEMGPYKLEEGPEGYNITKRTDDDLYYQEEYFSVYKDPETGGVEYEELTVKPDAEGKLKDVDYGVDVQTYRDIGKDIDQLTKDDIHKQIAEEDIQRILDDGGTIIDQGLLRSGKR